MRGELLFTKTDCVGILLSQQPKACYLHDFTSSWYQYLLEDFFYGVIRRKIKCVIVNILVSHVVKRVFDEELSWHSSTCPFSVFSFSIDHYLMNLYSRGLILFGNKLRFTGWDSLIRHRETTPSLRIYNTMVLLLGGNPSGDQPNLDYIQNMDMLDLLICVTHRI